MIIRLVPCVFKIYYRKLNTIELKEPKKYSAKAFENKALKKRGNHQNELKAF